MPRFFLVMLSNAKHLTNTERGTTEQAANQFRIPNFFQKSPLFCLTYTLLSIYNINTVAHC